MGLFLSGKITHMNKECTTRPIQWACRRGMLELDLLFEAYLAHAYPLANQEEQALFRQLLSETDQDLFDWIIHRKTPPNTAYTSLITHLQNRK